MSIMESTTLITFILNHSNARKVELLGSWDNFSGSYAMTKDSRRGHGIWSGCHTFKDIICDGDSDIHEARSGGLRMGGTYWYFYRIDDDEEYHDPSQPATSACPLLPGQTLNVLEVPFDTGRYVSHSRSSSVSISSAVQTLNPDDRYITPRPAPKPKMTKVITSAEAVAASGHIFTSSARHRPWTSVVGQGSDLRHPRSHSGGHEIRSASTSPTNATNVLKSAFMQLKGPVTALTPSEGGRGHRNKSASMSELRKNISRPLTMPSQLDRFLETLDESNEMSSAPRRAPLIVGERMHLSNRLVGRGEETERSTMVTTDSFQRENVANEHGRFASHKESGRPCRTSHRRGHSEDFGSRRSASLNGRFAPPQLYAEDSMCQFRFPSQRPQTLNHDMDFRTTDHHHSRNSSVNTNKELPPLPDFVMPEPLFYQSDTVGLRAASESLSLHDERAPHPKEVDMPLSESPGSPDLRAPYQREVDMLLSESPGSVDLLSDLELQSPTFSSIRGGDSGISTPHRLSNPPEWRLQKEDLKLNFNRSIERSSAHSRNVSTTSTAIYSLPVGCDGNPFAMDKSHHAQPELRQMSQMEKLLDEFEYLGATLL